MNFLRVLIVSLWFCLSSILYCSSSVDNYHKQHVNATTQPVRNAFNEGNSTIPNTANEYPLLSSNVSYPLLSSNVSYVQNALIKNFSNAYNSTTRNSINNTLNANYSTSDAIFSVTYWDVKPYIFKDEQNKIAGIIPRIFEEVSYFCGSYIGSQTLISYQPAVKSRQAFYDLLQSNADYEEDMFINASKNHAAWLPIMTEDHDDQLKHNKGLKSIILTKANKIAVILPREAMALPNKIYYGIIGCRQLFVLFGLLTVLFAILIWFFERFENDQFSRSFISGAGTSIWWSIVTMSTVGYGDIVPRSVAGRSITVVWVFIGILISSVVTATMTNFVADASYLSTYRRHVSVLRNSFEHKVAEMDHGAFVRPVDSYEAAIKLVREKKVFAAMINADVAAWYRSDYEDDSNDTPLRIVTTLPANLYIKALISGNMAKNIREILKCMHQLPADVLDHSTEHYQRYIRIESLYAGSVLDLLVTNIFTQVILGLILGLILIFVMVEVFKMIKLSPSKPKREEVLTDHYDMA